MSRDEATGGANVPPDAEIKAVLFDIDGTLLTTGGAGAVAWSRAFVDVHGMPVDIETVTESGMTDSEVASASLRSILHRDPTPEEISAVTELYLRYLPDAVSESKRYRLTPGIVECLERLKAQGLLLGLTTGNIEPAARIKLERGDLNRFFEFGGFGSDSNIRAELTLKGVQRGIEVSGGRFGLDDFIAIGDTPRDVEAGHTIGIRVVGVATGHFPANELEAAEADWVLETVEDGFPV
ncbi:MAG TPA: HAD family hydrolase [Solirubrobacterales bacterium]|nr:HAD family hydrolase [Solirubrobacterales bacterium]